MSFKRCKGKALFLYATVLLYVQYSRNCCKIEEASHKYWIEDHFEQTL